MEKHYRSLLPVSWLFLVSVLFILPGSALPKNTLLLGFGMDKIVHVGIFWVLLYLWSRAFRIKEGRSYVLLLGAAMLYGFLVEVVQHAFIPNRSFDLGDLLADLTGCVAGLFSWMLFAVYTKK